MPTLLTIGQIAEAHRVPLHRISYIVRTLALKPAARARHYRLFDAEAVRRIEEVLQTRKGQVAHD